MIFPWGGEATASLVLPSLQQLRPELEPRPPLAGDPIPVCIDHAGVGRPRHSWDKDRQCVFCDRKRIRRRRS
jgi:hypothetical protein